MTCVFFGHRDTPDSIRPILHDLLITLIEQRGVRQFYVGNQGHFDSMVRSELRQLAKIFPQIRYAVVLAYLPGKKDEYDSSDGSETVYPEGLEAVPRRFAIDKRNRMMVEWADIVVTYIAKPCGGAAKFGELAAKKGKEIVNLYHLDG